MFGEVFCPRVRGGDRLMRDSTLKSEIQVNGTAVRVVETDVLVIGTEATGGKAALEAADLFPDCRIVAVSK